MKRTLENVRFERSSLLLAESVSTLPPEHWQEYFSKGFQSVEDFVNQMLTTKKHFERGLDVLQRNRGFIVDGACEWLSDSAMRFGESIPGWFSAKNGASTTGSEAVQQAAADTSHGWFVALLYDEVFDNSKREGNFWGSVWAYCCPMLLARVFHDPVIPSTVRCKSTTEERARNWWRTEKLFTHFFENDGSGNASFDFRNTFYYDTDIEKRFALEAWTETILSELVRLLQSKPSLQRKQYTEDAHVFFKDIFLLVPRMTYPTRGYSNYENLTVNGKVTQRSDHPLLYALFMPKVDDDQRFPLLEKAYKRLWATAPDKFRYVASLACINMPLSERADAERYLFKTFKYLSLSFSQPGVRFKRGREVLRYKFADDEGKPVYKNLKAYTPSELGFRVEDYWKYLYPRPPYTRETITDD